MTIQVKRVYEPPEDSDGVRILVDRLWPRGLSREDAKIGFWAKNVAPSTELRRWYSHDPEKWSEFKTRYHAELATCSKEVVELLEYVRSEVVTFLYSSKERKLNNAVALKEYIERMVQS